MCTYKHMVRLPIRLGEPTCSTAFQHALPSPEFHQNSPECLQNFESEHLKKGDNHNSAFPQLDETISNDLPAVVYIYLYVYISYIYLSIYLCRARIGATVCPSDDRDSFTCVGSSPRTLAFPQGSLIYIYIYIYIYTHLIIIIVIIEIRIIIVPVGNLCGREPSVRARRRAMRGW